MSTRPTSVRTRRARCARASALALGVLLALGVASLALPAEAQLEAGRSHLAEADFERAERAFSRALTEAELSREDVVAIHEGRAICRWALGDEDGARADLAALGSLEPEHTLPPEAPPPLIAAFAALPRQALGLALGWDDAEGGAVRLHVSLQNDAALLVETIRVHTRASDGEPWSVRDEPNVTIRLRAGDRVQVWVAAIGPGGAILAQEGSAGAPLVREHGAMDVRGVLGAPGREADMTAIWIGVGIGAAVLVGLAIGIGVGVGTAESELTQPARPVVIGF